MILIRNLKIIINKINKINCSKTIVQEEAIEFMIKNSSGIEIINIMNVDSAFTGLKLFAGNVLTELYALHLSYTKVCDGALLHLPRAFPSLEYLDLSGTRVSEDTLEEIVTKCNHLNSIFLSSCRNLERPLRSMSVTKLRDEFKSRR